jgi:ankyrin repeat protein
VSENREAYDLACSKYDAKRGKTASRTEVLELLHIIVDYIPGCVFIVDGLDECVRMSTDGLGSLDILLRGIKQAIAHTSTRILVVSRNEKDIESGIFAIDESNPVTVHEYKISSEDVRADATSFSKGIINLKLPNKDEEFKNSLTSRIIDRCDGMFLWAKILGDQLRASQTKKQLENIVDRTPSNVERLYDSNWARICNQPDHDRDRAFSILRWTAFSLRPLTTAELIEALLITDDDVDDDISAEELPDTTNYQDYVNGEIIGLCKSLVEIRQGQDLATSTIQPIHFSAKQYILCHTPLPGFLVVNERLVSSNQDLQNNVLARLCLRYLNIRDVWKDDNDIDAKRLPREFRSYAADSWYQHIRPNNEAVVETIKNFLQPDNKNWDHWRRWFDKKEPRESSEDILDVSPLYYASLFGLETIVAYLRDHVGLDINHQDGLNRTALQAASSKGHESLVKYILGSAADVNAADKDGWTPLNLACVSGNLSVVQVLLEKGADITVANNEGCAPLSSASKHGHLDVVRTLLERGADWKTVDNVNRTPVYTASLSGHVKIVDLLIESGADISVANIHGWTPISTASSCGHLDVVKLLIEKGADVVTPWSGGLTPLNSAAISGHVEVTKLLLENGADITAPDKFGRKPLNSAAIGGQVEITKLLLQNGADITATDSDGRTSLGLAAVCGHVEVVKFLLQSGADITVRDNDERTCLALAAVMGYAEVTKLLVETGADVNARDDNGRTPLNFAAICGHDEVAKLLLENGADITTPTIHGIAPLMSAATNGNVEVVKTLLERGADSTATSKDGLTALILAAYGGHAEIVRILVEGGADIEFADNSGWTPLNAAASEGHVQVVKAAS